MMSPKVHKYACSRILLINQILNPKQVTQISACNFHQDPGESKCGWVCNIWALGYPGISGVVRCSVIIQMSSLGRATDVQHNYPVYLNCHLSHLASRTLPPSSISQTLSTDSTQPRNLVPFNVKRNQGWSRETFWVSNVIKSVRRNRVVLKKRKWHSWKWKSWL